MKAQTPRTPTEEQRIEARRNAKRPNLTCSLGDNHSPIDCDLCRELPPIHHNGKTYFCFKEAGLDRFFVVMKDFGKNIQIQWSGSYMKELPDDNEGDCSGTDVPVVNKETTEIDTSGVDSQADQQGNTEAQLETQDAVGVCYRG